MAQGDDPNHTAKITREWLAKQNFKLLYWPQQPQDLNAIGNAWVILNKKLKNYGSVTLKVHEFGAEYKKNGIVLKQINNPNS